MNILVLGSRDGQGFIEAVDELGRTACTAYESNGLVFWCGNYGRLAQVLGGHVHCTCHIVRTDLAFPTNSVGTIIIQPWDSFGKRLDHFWMADGSLFFPGGDGTFAHAALAIHRNKHYSGGRVKPIAIVGWSRGQASELVDGMGIAAYEIERWFRVFPLDQVAEAFRFVTTAVPLRQSDIPRQ